MNYFQHQSNLLIAPQSDWAFLIEQLHKGVATADFWLPKDWQKEISMEELREALDFANRSALGDKKIIIITNINQIPDFKASVLLKTLEEPTEGVYIFLIGESVQVLPTIRSRVFVQLWKKATALPVSSFEGLTTLEATIYQRLQGQLQSLNPASLSDREKIKELLYIYPLLHANIGKESINKL
jgi:hypothetical protein